MLQFVMDVSFALHLLSQILSFSVIFHLDIIVPPLYNQSSYSRGSEIFSSFLPMDVGFMLNHMNFLCWLNFGVLAPMFPELVFGNFGAATIVEPFLLSS